MKINFIDLKAQYEKNKSIIDSAIGDVLKDSNFILGKQVKDFENLSGNYVGAKCLTVANGTDALFIALKSIGISAGDEIITPSFTWVSTVEVIKQIGAIPVYVDVKESDFNINEEQVENLITSKTKAIISVSIFGRCPDLFMLKEITRKHDIYLIEDAAQSYGAKISGKISCSVADISTTSFFPAKPLGCYGDGGAIYSNDEQIFKEATMISRHGQDGRYNYLRVGQNSRLDTIQAAILLKKHEIFENEILSKNNVAKKYQQKLSKIPTIKTPDIPDLNNRSVWAQYTILLSNDIKSQRSKIMSLLKDEGIPTALYYPVLLHKTKVYFDNIHLPISENICDRVLSLPMHPYLDEEKNKFYL